MKKGAGHETMNMQKRRWFRCWENTHRRRTRRRHDAVLSTSPSRGTSGRAARRSTRSSWTGHLTLRARPHRTPHLQAEPHLLTYILPPDLFPWGTRSVRNRSKPLRFVCARNLLSSTGQVKEHQFHLLAHFFFRITRTSELLTESIFDQS